MTINRSTTRHGAVQFATKEFPDLGHLQIVPVNCILSGAMKTRVGIVIVVLTAVVLGIALLSVKHEATKQHAADTEKIVDLSNNVSFANAKLDETRQVAALLE